MVVNKIEEFRSTMLKELGTYSNVLEKELKDAASVSEKLTLSFGATCNELEKSLEAIIIPVQEKAEASKQRLAELQQGIIQVALF